MNEEIELEFDVLRTADLKIEQAFIPLPWVENGAFNTNIKLTNTGNSNDMYDVTILNLDELTQQGWDAALVGGGVQLIEGQMTNISVPTDQRESVLTLTLEPNRTHPARDVVVALSARSTFDPTKVVVLEVEYETPELVLGKDDLKIDGEGLTYTDDFVFPYWTILLMVATAALLISGYLYTRTRRW